MQSMTALTIDAMLPALPEIGRDLGTSHPNDVQLVVLIMLLGFGLGQIFYGPVSDSIGRKPPIYAGLVIYALGGLVCIFSETLFIMLCGRFLQGIGIASPRIVMNAVIRDRYKGPEMARVMSFVMAVFILVPVIAPSIGQLILIFFNWEAIDLKGENNATSCGYFSISHIVVNDLLVTVARLFNAVIWICLYTCPGNNFSVATVSSLATAASTPTRPIPSIINAMPSRGASNIFINAKHLLPMIDFPCCQCLIECHPIDLG